MFSGGIDPVSVPPAAAISDVCADADVPPAKVTMYGTGAPENASLNFTSAVAPAPSVAVAVKVEAKEGGNAKESLIVPSAATTTSLSLVQPLVPSSATCR